MCVVDCRRWCCVGAVLLIAGNVWMLFVVLVLFVVLLFVVCCFGVADV